MKKRQLISKISTTFTVAAMSIPLALSYSGLVSADSVRPGSCTAVSLQTALAPGQPADQTIKGTLCNPSNWSGTHEVDVLVHGATYNRSYWDWPIDNAQYSYVNQTLRAGRATFAYDLLGSGASSHPLSTDVTVDAQAYTLHQVLNWLHGQSSYQKFDVVGHSVGSITAVAEASAYHDENGLVLTGYTHAVNPVDQATIITKLYPANLDPQFANDGFDSGYLTTLPGTRGSLFYSSIADPAIVAYDEAHKDVASSTYFGSSLSETMVPAGLNVSNQINVPVLEVIGQEDFLFCGTGAIVDCANPAQIRNFDAPYFTSAPSLDVSSIPNTGHDLALHPTNGLSFADINGWIKSH